MINSVLISSQLKELLATQVLRMNEVYDKMIVAVSQTANIVNLQVGGDAISFSFTIEGLDILVAAYREAKPGFVDEALDTSLTTIEDADTAIRMARQDQSQINEISRALGIRLSENIENYALLRFRLDHGESFLDYVLSLRELNK